MPDITDLHAAFTELEAQAPTELRAPARTGGRPRRLVPVLAAAGAVAATVAALVIGPNLMSGRPTSPSANAVPKAVSASAATTPATPAAPKPLSLTTSYYSTDALPDGFIVTYDEHTATAETLLLGTGGDIDHNAMVQVVIATSAAAQPVAPADAAAVTVNGRPGRASAQFRRPGAPPKAQPVTGVLWTDAAGRTVFVYHPGDEPLDDHPDVPVSAATLLATANALSIGSAETNVRTPVKFGYLPARSAINEVTVGQQKFDEQAPEVSVTYDHLIITVMPGTAERGRFGPAVDQAPQTTTIHVNGFSGLYSPQDSTVVVDNGAVLISIDNYNGQTFVGPGLGLSVDEVTKILNAVTVTPTPASAAAWFDLATAMP